MNFKKFLALFVAVCFSFVFVACQDTTTNETTKAPTSTETDTTATTEDQTSSTETTAIQSTTLSILNGWSDSGDSVYTITQDDTNLAVSYDKNNFSWASMSYPITNDLSDYNKLVFSVSGSGTMMVKIQGATEAFEVSIQLTAGAVTYQINLRDYDDFLAGVTEVVIFAGPGKAADTGNFTMSKFEFDEGTAYGNVLEKGDSNIPQNQQTYDGTGETFDFSAGFVDNGDAVYTIDDSGAAPLVSYTKAPGFEWAYLLSTVVGNFSDFDYIVLELTGVTAGSVLFKAELSGSVQAEISGTYEADETITLCIDLTSWTNEQMDALTKVLIFAAGGSASGSGSFTIDAAYFSKVLVGDPVVEPENMYSFMNGWTEGDAGTYAFSTSEDETTIVNYTKVAEQGWVFMGNVFTAEADEYNTMIFTVKGTDGESILIKPNDDGSLEQTITFDGTEQTVTISAKAFTKMIIFAMPGTDSVTGSFEIIEAKLVYVTPEPVPASTVYDMQADWIDNDGGLYTLTNTDGVVTVDYTREATQNWTFIKSTFTENLSNLNVIELQVQGTIGDQLLIKPNDNGAYEQTITFDGTIQTITFTLTDTPVNILIFVDPINATTTGSFDIISAVVKAMDPTLVNFIGDLEENDLGTYTVTELTEGIQVDYTKAAGQEWAFFKAMFNQDLVAGRNTMTLVLNGTDGESVLIKPNDNNVLEQTIVFDGTDQTVVITFDSFQSLIMFVEPDSAGSGTFYIKEATLSYVEPMYDFSTGWVDGGDAVYTITENADDTATVDYAKGAGQTWSSFKNDFTAEADGFNTMTLTVQGTIGETILIKPNNNNALEQTITFDGTEQTVVISADSFTNIIIFAMPNTESVSGTFTIIESKLTYVESDSVPAYEEIVLGNEWEDNDGGIYTFTDNLGVVTVSFSKVDGQAWAYMVYSIDQNLENHDTITMVVNGSIGQQLIIKPNNNGDFEQTVTFDGTDQTLTFTLTETLTEIIIFADPINAALTGEFDIVSVKVSSTKATVDFTDTFAENDLGTYALTTEADDSITVNYTKTAGQEWAFMKAEFNASDVAGLNTMTVMVQGTDGLSILLKPNDDNGLEQSVIFDGTVQTIIVSADMFSSLVVFAEAGTTDVTGTFSIISAVLSYVEPIVE